MEGLLLLALFVGAIVVMARLSTLSARLARMESQALDQAQKIRDLARRLDEMSRLAQPPVAPSPPAPEASSEKIPEETRVSEFAPVEAARSSAPSQAGVVEPNLASPSLPKSPASPRLASFEKLKNLAEWEALIGGNVLNRVGALALILGVGFFLKYAFDNDLISPATRVVIGAAIGAGLIVGGGRAFAKGYDIFAQGLFGAGISALYLSIYAAFNFYKLTPQPAAFVLMSVVTATSLVIATRCDSIAISLLGWAGGFLTPFLLASAEPNAVGLFVYLALLNLGMLAVTFVKAEWVAIEALSIGATSLVYAIWFLARGETMSALAEGAFLTLIWALFFASEAYRAAQNDARKLRGRAIASAMNAACYFGCLYASTTPSRWLGAWTLAIAGVYLAFFVALQRRREAVAKEILATYAIGSVAFLAAAAEVEFGDFLVVASWSAIAFGALWVAIPKADKALERVAFILFGLAAFRLLISPDALSYQAILDFKPAFNLRALAFLSLGLSLFLGAKILRPTNATTATFFDYAWSCVAFAWLTVEVNDFFLMREAQVGEAIGFSRSARPLSFGLIWALYAVALLWWGAKSSMPALAHIGLALLALGLFWNLAFGWRFEPIAAFLPILNLRALSLLVLIGAIALTLSLLAQRGEAQSATADALRYAFAILILFLLTTEALDYFRWAEFKRRSDESFYRAATLGLLWTLFAAPMVWFGIKKAAPPLFYAGAFAFAMATLALLFGGFSYRPIENYALVWNYRVLAYLTLVGGGAFIAIAFSKDAERQRLATIFGVGAALMGAITLVAEANDFFEQKIYWLSFGEHAEATTAELMERFENQKQLAISAALTLYSIALMLYGIWRARQPIRLTAIAFFGLAILKIFIYDLSFLATLYRIFSFIGLGAFLLLVSYLYQRYKRLILPEAR